MTVQQLIEALSRLPRDLPVLVQVGDDPDTGVDFGLDVVVTDPEQPDDGCLVIRPFC